MSEQPKDEQADQQAQLVEMMKGFDAMEPLLAVSQGMIKKLQEAGFTQQDASTIVTEMIMNGIRQATEEAAAQAKRDKGRRGR